MNVRHGCIAAALCLASPLAAQMAATPAYHIANKIVLGGDGGWDYLMLDTTGNRLFITRTDRVVVVDPATGNVLGQVAGLNRGHGVAIDAAAGRGFVSSGADSTVTIFDLHTYAVISRVKADDDDDAILYDAASNRVFTFNGDAGTASVIDPDKGTRVGSVKLDGKPEFGVSAGDGKLYVNIESESEIAEIDARAMKVTRTWKLTPCESPSGLAIDVGHRRLFSVCHNKTMAISDIAAGKVVASVAIGSGVDAARFDAGTQEAFASNGDGSLTVVHEDTPNTYHVEQNVTTMTGARTMELDPRSHRVYLVTAQFGAVPDSATAANPRRRPPMIPGTFMLLVLER